MIKTVEIHKPDISKLSETQQEKYNSLLSRYQALCSKETRSDEERAEMKRLYEEAEELIASE